MLWLASPTLRLANTQLRSVPFAPLQCRKPAQPAGLDASTAIAPNGRGRDTPVSRPCNKGRGRDTAHDCIGRDTGLVTVQDLPPARQSRRAAVAADSRAAQKAPLLPADSVVC